MSMLKSTNQGSKKMTSQEVMVFLAEEFMGLGYEVQPSLATKFLVEKGEVKGHVILNNPWSVTRSSILISLGNYKHNFRRSVYIENNKYDASELLKTLRELEV